MNDNESRAAMVRNLHAMGELLDTHPDLPHLPYVTTSVDGSVSGAWYLSIHTGDHGTQKARAAEIVQALGGRWDKVESGEAFNFTQRRDGLRFTVQVDRPAVCERVVVGTETVTREITDPDAPKVTVTEEIEKVEWRCQPLLGGLLAEQAESVTA